MLFRCAKTGSVALICWLAQQHAAFTAKIGIYNLHKRCAEFLNACTASNASAYDYLTTYLPSLVSVSGPHRSCSKYALYAAASLK